MTITSPSTPSKSSGRRANALPAGCMLDEYRIESILGAGGFGVTYKALDTHLDAWVAIKEYFPVEWSFRDPDGLTVHPNTQSDASSAESDYHWGLERFLDEARVLARIQHPYVVRVKRYFRAHDTAYIVMDYEDGQPLSQVLRDGETLREDEVRGLLEDVLPALRAVHEQGYLHRDIKPSNLYVRASDHRVILIDFGAARQAAGRHSQSMTSLVTPGFSPPEQYTTRNDRYGAWTDIYALGAVLYRCVTGRTPTEAADRLLDDTLEPAVKAGAGRYSTNLLRVIDQTLAVRPDQRFLTVANMQAALAGAQDDDSDETVIMLPIKAVKSLPTLEVSRITRLLEKSAMDQASPDAPHSADRSKQPAPEPVEPDHSNRLNITQPPASTQTASVEQRQNAPSQTASRWRLTAFAVGGLVLTAVAVLLIWLGLSEPSSQLAPEPKPSPRYRLGQLEPVIEQPLPPATATPASDATPSALAPTSDTSVDSPALNSGVESTNLSTTAPSPVVASETEAATAEGASANAETADSPATSDGTEPAVTEETLEIPAPQSGSSTGEEAELTAAQGAAETTVEGAGVKEPKADAADALVAPGIVPATITPKINTDTATKPTDERAAERRIKTPKKTQRTRRTVRKDPRPWKVIPHDQPVVRQPSRLDSNKASRRDDRWDAPGSSGFNQK